MGPNQPVQYLRERSPINPRQNHKRTIYEGQVARVHNIYLFTYSLRAFHRAAKHCRFSRVAGGLSTQGGQPRSQCRKPPVPSVALPRILSSMCDTLVNRIILLGGNNCRREESIYLL